MAKKVKMTAALHPFKAERKCLDFKQGMTVHEMLTVAQPDIEKAKHAMVFINGNIVSRETWRTYKPRGGEIVEARAYPVPRGGGGGGGKDVLRIVLTIAVIAVAAWAGPALAAMAGFTGATSAAVAGSIFTGLTAAIGMMAVNALVPVIMPKMDQLSSTAGTSDSPTLYINGARNSLNPFAPVPVILGKYRAVPSLGSKPYTEIIGEDQYLRMLFVWGIGPLSIDTDSLKIGDTLLSEFSDYQIEHREGYDTDEPLTLFPSAINQEDFSILLSQSSSWITRTTNIFSDEIGIDINFPQGLVEYDNNGNKQDASVNIEIEYSPVGSPSSWTKIDTSNAKFQTTIPTSWLNKSGDDINSITFTSKRTAGIRHGIRFGVSERGQYDIRIRRVSADTDSTLIYDKLYWTALKSITAEDPVNSPVPLAMTAIVIKATDQLNGIIDNFSGEVTSVCNDWTGSPASWEEQATQNPASLFRHILQGNGTLEPLPDSRIDLDSLEEWHEFCDEKGYKFNMIRDYASSIWDVLADVAAAGRAAPAQVDGKWGVVIDKVQDSPVSMITPRNSFSFKAEKVFLNAPHGWRIRFPNEEQGYTFDERRVYMNGYSADNATKFESLELPGVTDPDQIFRLGRYRIAQVLNLTERWSFKQDIEFLTYKRGDRVTITHDVLLVGLGYGRIKGLTLDGTDVTGIELDEEVTMEAGKDYGVAIRTREDPNLTAQVVTEAGTTKSLTFSTPIPGIGSPAEAAIVVGNIFGFGILGEEQDDATIIKIEPYNNMQAQITAIPYRSEIYDFDDEEIPIFETTITELPVVPAPRLISISSDEGDMVLSSTGALKIRVRVGYEPLSRESLGAEPELIIQMRYSGNNEPFYAPMIEEQGRGYFYIGDVRTNEIIDIRMRFKVPGRLPGPWTTISGYTVVGKSSAPSPLANMTISAFGGQAMIRWDRPAELDVLFGGEVVFRHNPAFEDATWAGSVTIGQSALARTLFAVLPLKPGTYLARVYDVDGNPSDTITMVTTKQASVNEFVSVDTLDEASSFLGDKTDMVVDSGNLTLDDTLSPGVLEGRYEFANGVDLTTVSRVRLTTRLTVSIYEVGDTIDSRLDNIDSWDDFDGTVLGGVDARVFVRHTDDDPAGSPVSWSDWERLDSAEFEARGFQFYLDVDRESLDYNILISELGVDFEEIV